MKRSLKKRSTLYTYLESTKILETGTEEQINLAKKAYWKEYKRVWRKHKRRAEKELTLSFNRPEMKIVTDEARKHKMSRTGYIKRATLAYIDKIYLVTDLEQVRRITQLLAMNYNIIQRMVEDGQLTSTLGNTVLAKVSDLEKQVLIQLHHPKTLEELIKDQIRIDSSIKEKIFKLLHASET